MGSTSIIRGVWYNFVFCLQLLAVNSIILDEILSFPLTIFFISPTGADGAASEHGDAYNHFAY